MELVYTYVKKHASVSYHSCADGPLKSQCNVLLSQCQQHNSRLLGKQLKKKVKKERRRLREDIEKISENLLKIATASSSEMDELWATAGNL